MASAWSSVVSGGLSNAASFVTDFLPILALVVGLAIAGIVAFLIRDLVRGG